jgi:hypothetical protein
MFLIVLLDKKNMVMLAGVTYGFWVHFRVYPAILAISFLLYFGKK